MLLKIILLLTLTPIVELWILFRIAGATSPGFTVLLVIVTGIIGGILAKMEGLRVLEQLQRELQAGQLPAGPLLDGAMVLVAGALLLTPGVITDAVGFSLLAPPWRNILKKCLKRKLKKMMASGRVRMYKDMGFGPIHRTPPPGAPPLENDNDDEEGEHENHRERRNQ